MAYEQEDLIEDENIAEEIDDIEEDPEDFPVFFDVF